MFLHCFDFRHDAINSGWRKRMRAALYARVSTEDQPERYGVVTQVRDQ